MGRSRSQASVGQVESSSTQRAQERRSTTVAGSAPALVEGAAGIGAAGEAERTAAARAEALEPTQGEAGVAAEANKTT